MGGACGRKRVGKTNNGQAHGAWQALSLPPQMLPRSKAGCHAARRPCPQVLHSPAQPTAPTHTSSSARVALTARHTGANVPATLTTCGRGQAAGGGGTGRGGVSPFLPPAAFYQAPPTAAKPGTPASAPSQANQPQRPAQQPVLAWASSSAWRASYDADSCCRRCAAAFMVLFCKAGRVESGGAHVGRGREQARGRHPCTGLDACCTPGCGTAAASAAAAAAPPPSRHPAPKHQQHNRATRGKGRPHDELHAVLLHLQLLVARLQ